MTPAFTNGDIRSSIAYRIRLPVTAVCLLTGLILAVLSEPRVPSESEHHWVFTAAGFVLLIAGILLRIWATASISDRKSSELVMSGPYSLSRNPLYLGTFLIVSGFLAFWHSATLLLFAAPPMLLYIFGVVPAEERLLASRFGEAFAEYASRTPRWLPNRYQYAPEPSSAIRTAGFWQEVQSGAWWLILGALSHFLCHLRTMPWWAEPFRLP